MEQNFELKVIDNNGKTKIVTWVGKDGLDACHRYADAHPGVQVWAWRYPRNDVVIGDPSMIVG